MKKVKLFIVSAAVLSGFVVPVAVADQFSLGAGVLVSPDPYKGYQKRVYPVPLINYDSERFYFKGLTTGYYLWNDGTNQLSVTAFYSPLHYRAKESNNRAMKELNNRHSSVMAGVSYQHKANWGNVRTTLAGDVLDNSNGVMGDVAYSYSFRNGDWQIAPGIGASWFNERMNRYYYGISGKESGRSGMSRYRPGNSWSPYLEMSVNYSLGSDWSVLFSGRYFQLNKQITDSPMVNQNYSAMFMTGINYSF